jgi:response regulator RpfG family c-di-GMP phosphodiesterase
MDTTILVVDDSKMQLHMMDKILTDLGYKQIETAMNVEDAKKILAEKKIDLIFSDWHMPGGTGLDFLKFVRATKDYEAIPFLIVTTEHEKTNIYEAARSGLQNYIFKPVNKDIIKRKLYDLTKAYPSINPPQEAL